jgi:hypothetical protein
MGAPSNETEAETLRRRQVEALEAIAKALATLASVVRDDHVTDRPHVCVRDY